MVVCSGSVNTGRAYICQNVESVYFNLEGFDIGSFIEVAPETVGQFTGTTKGDRKVFEGDIGWDAHDECYGVVELSEGKFVYVWENICTDLFEIADDIDFVGNRWDSPELLEGAS